MTSVSDQPVERADLERFGYPQELHRRVGPFASFAAGFSFVSILTTVFQLFFLGYGFGGAAFFWTWPIVFGGQLLVALNFSTLAARFPISGAIYQWSSRLAGSTFGWSSSMTCRETRRWRPSSENSTECDSSCPARTSASRRRSIGA